MRFDHLTSLIQTPQWLQHPLAPSTNTLGSGFDWDRVRHFLCMKHKSMGAVLTVHQTPATKHFSWYSCYDDKFKCARLEVPMDWTGTSAQANKTVELAVIKVEATVPIADPSYGGAVVLNPGKPVEHNDLRDVADGGALQEDQEAPELVKSFEAAIMSGRFCLPDQRRPEPSNGSVRRPRMPIQPGTDALSALRRYRLRPTQREQFSAIDSVLSRPISFSGGEDRGRGLWLH